MARDTLRHCYPILELGGYWFERVDLLLKTGYRQDFGGFADILAWTRARPGVLAIQSCTEGHKRGHQDKIAALPRVMEWLGGDRRLELWVWCKRKRKGKDKLVLRDFVCEVKRGRIVFNEGASEIHGLSDTS